MPEDKVINDFFDEVTKNEGEIKEIIIEKIIKKLSNEYHVTRSAFYNRLLNIGIL